MTAPLKTIDELTGEWLGGALGRPSLELGEVERIGTGQMSTSYRTRYSSADGEGSVVVKLAATDDASRQTGVGLGAYLREITFYRELRDRIGGPLAACHLAEYDPDEGWFTLVLEDIEGGVQGDQIAGCTPEQARTAMVALARIHAPVFGDLALAASGWLNGDMPLNQGLLASLLPGFIERYGERIEPEHQEVCRRFVAVADSWIEGREPPLGLVHGDYRLDNLLFHDGGLTVVDWQTVSCGPVMRDAGYFIGGGLDAADRREHEQGLVRTYHEELERHGVQGFSWERCWEEYRGQCFLGILMAIGASMLVERTERGDEMFMATLSRNAQMAIDLDAIELLPQAGAGPAAALTPEPEDEGRHPPGAEELWNESWYFDAISDDGRIGFYHRIGRMPNKGACLLSTCIVRPGKAAIMLVDASAPLPPEDDPRQAIATDSASAEQECLEPLDRFHVRVSGTALAHGDHSAPLRGESGEPVEIAADLTWDTDGVPYSWRLATRYEIPCRVNGTITIAGEAHEFSGVGQRDHSWGARDWWGSDWMWSALHLDDGTHTHAVSVPTHPGFGVGYVQKGDELVEVGGVESSEDVAGDGLITRARIGMSPGTPDGGGAGGPVEVEVEPVAFGALRLEAPDGRVSHFPRAMCRVKAVDGREGVGWVEWNRNQG